MTGGSTILVSPSRVLYARRTIGSTSATCLVASYRSTLPGIAVWIPAFTDAIPARITSASVGVNGTASRFPAERGRERLRERLHLVFVRCHEIAVPLVLERRSDVVAFFDPEVALDRLGVDEDAAPGE